MRVSLEIVRMFNNTTEPWVDFTSTDIYPIIYRANRRGEPLGVASHFEHQHQHQT
jgi:hypothetical protein